ncbi:katanin p80 WD40 repeat-containing subunit B1 homolog isoform X2, partial [Olea europaea subsp. europaea]
ANDGMSVKPPHTRRLSNARFGMKRMSVSLESPVFVSRSPVGNKKDKCVADDNPKESFEEKQSSIETLAEKFGKTPVMARPSSQGNC